MGPRHIHRITMKKLPFFSAPEQPKLQRALNNLVEAVNTANEISIEGSPQIGVTREGNRFTVEYLEQLQLDVSVRFRCEIDALNNDLYIGKGHVAFLPQVKGLIVPIRPTLDGTEIGELFDGAKPAKASLGAPTGGLEWWVIVVCESDKAEILLHNTATELPTIKKGQFYFQIAEITGDGAKWDINQIWDSDIEVLLVDTTSSGSSASSATSNPTPPPTSSSSGGGGGGTSSSNPSSNPSSSSSSSSSEDCEPYYQINYQGGGSDRLTPTNYLSYEYEIGNDNGYLHFFEGRWYTSDNMGNPIENYPGTVNDPSGTTPSGHVIVLIDPCPPSSTSSSPSGESKTTAIVPASWSSVGYTALFVSESPEVRFTDVLVILVPSGQGRKLNAGIDRKFLEVCEEGSLEAVGYTTEKAVSVGLLVVGERIELRLPEDRPKRIVVSISAIRKGFRGLRFPDRDKYQFDENEKFINSIASKLKSRHSE